jgi:hypothetical protein
MRGSNNNEETQSAWKEPIAVFCKASIADDPLQSCAKFGIEAATGGPNVINLLNGLHQPKGIHNEMPHIRMRLYGKHAGAWLSGCRTILIRMKTLHALLVVSSIVLSASAQNQAPTSNTWGPAKEGVRVSLSLVKFIYAVGEDIPLHIAAQVVSANHPVYGEPDRPSGAFFLPWDFSRAFHLTITNENGLIVGNNSPSNLIFILDGSSGPDMCPVPLEVGRVYTLEQSASRKQKLLPTQPGTYRLTVTWSPYPASDPPCEKSRATSDLEKFRPFVTVSSIPISIQVTGNPQ